MRLAVVTTFLLLLDILDTVTASIDSPSPWDECLKVPTKPCGGGWTQVAENYCVKYFRTAKTFKDAQDECQSHGADLLKIEKSEYMLPLLCFTLYTTAPSERQSIWIGNKRSVDKLKKAEVPVLDLHYDLAGGDCVYLDLTMLGELNDVPCSKKNYFVCVKKTDELPNLA